MVKIGDYCPAQPRQRRHRRVLAIAIVLACAVLAAPALFLVYVEWSSVRWEKQRSRDQLEDQIRGIQGADSDRSIYLYETSGTNDLLKRLSEVPEVELLKLELTDVTDKGMRYVAALPKLKSLTVYGGYWSVGNRGLAQLRRLANLKHLELINTRVTDDGLVVLKDVPRLQSLVLFHEAWRGRTFTDAGVAHLKGLTNLQTLELIGGWISDEAARELQRALPNCKITWTRASDDEPPALFPD